jgi:hypothetical protein
MKIAILGWGSLIWDPQGIPTTGKWQCNGPKLPIEFSRISGGKQLTLVIDAAHGNVVSTRYIESARLDLGDAIDDLKHREKTIRKYIGFIDLGSGTSSAQEFPEHQAASSIIDVWLKSSGFDALVWTALPSNFQREQRNTFTPEAAVRFLDSLSKFEQENAYKYIRRAPEEVRTPLRDLLRESGKIKPKPTQ